MTLQQWKSRAFLLLFLVWVAVLPVVAQDEAPPSDAAVSDEPVRIALEHASARSAMTTFLEAFDPEKTPDAPDLEAAAATLDLSGISEDLRPRLGPELAVSLKDVLDRIELIDLDAMPDDPAAGDWVLEIPDEEAEVRLAPNARGEWLFTADTVTALPKLSKALENRRVVEGVVATTAPLTPARWLREQIPPSLKGGGFLLEHWQWMALFLLILLGLVLDRLVTSLVQTAIEAQLKRRMEVIETGELQKALRPIGLLAAALTWRPSIFLLGLPPTVLEVLLVAVHFLAITAFVWAAYRMVDIVSAVLALRAERTQHKFDDLLVPLFRKSMKIFVAALGLVFIADNLDIQITSLLAGLGVGGLAVALAAQDAVKNVFGSLMVITDRPFAIGDWVKVGDVEGTVEELGFRSTRVRTFYNSLITLPNSNLINAAVDNFGARKYRRWSTKLQLTYDTPPEKMEAFCEGVRELIRLHPLTRKDFYMVNFTEFGASSLDVMLYMFFEAPDWTAEIDGRNQLALDILRVARELGVSFAFPTQTIHLVRGDGAQAGD